MKKLYVFMLAVLCFSALSFAQDRSILVPKQVPGAPFAVTDGDDLFGQSYRWFVEGDVEKGAQLLRSLVEKAGVTINPNVYYVVVANYTDSFNPIGMFHGSDEFLSTRMYGLSERNLFYVYISRDKDAPSWLSVLATSKASPFMENLPAFLGFFTGLTSSAVSTLAAGPTTFVDVRQFDVPEVYRKNADLSFMVKKELGDEKVLAQAVFDNTAKERWSYGVATAITSVNDVDIIVGNDGTIIVDPKPNLDLATFAVVNYHFQPVDTKAKSLATSFHLLGGLRLAQSVEPILGVGGGLPLGGVIDLHLFAGYSLEFANELEPGFSIGQKVGSEVDPFKLKLRGKPRFGIEIKFP